MDASSPTASSAIATGGPSPLAARQKAALQKANARRRARSQLRRDLALGRVRLADILRDPPEALRKLPLLDLLRLSSKIGPERCVQINRRAVSQGINLALPLGRASQATRSWLAEASVSAAPRTRPAHAPVFTPTPCPRLAAAPGPEPLERQSDTRAWQLAAAIDRHRRAVRGPGPVTEFGDADDALYERCRRIMATVDDHARAHAA